MSVAAFFAPPRAPSARPGQAAGHGRLALLFAVILATSVSGFALALVSFLWPIGAAREFPDYAALAPIRDYAWAFFVTAAVQLIIGVCAAAIAGWILTPARGARLATVGGSLLWLGAAVYGVGVSGWAAIYYFGTDPAANPATARVLIDHANGDPLRMFALPFGGAAVIALGSLVLVLALWRAGTVPRWVVLLGAISSVATLLLPPASPLGLVAEAASSLSTTAIGWYAWRSYGIDAPTRSTDATMRPAGRTEARPAPVSAER
jgi:hypothetical protein